MGRRRQKRRKNRRRRERGRNMRHYLLLQNISLCFSDLSKVPEVACDSGQVRCSEIPFVGGLHHSLQELIEVLTTEGQLKENEGEEQ